MLTASNLFAQTQEEKERQTINKHISVINQAFNHWNALNQQLVELNKLLITSENFEFNGLGNYPWEEWNTLYAEYEHLKTNRSTHIQSNFGFYENFNKAFNLINVQVALTAELMGMQNEEDIFYQLKTITTNANELVIAGYDFSLASSIAFGKDEITGNVKTQWNAAAQAKNILMGLRFQNDEVVNDYFSRMKKAVALLPSSTEYSTYISLTQEYLNYQKLHDKPAFTHDYYDVIPHKKLYEIEFDKLFNLQIAENYNKQVKNYGNKHMQFVLEPIPFYFADKPDKLPINNGETVFNAHDFTTLQGAVTNNLVLLIDASGSMQNESKMPLLKLSLEHLASIFRQEDKIGLVTYAGVAKVIYGPTNIEDEKELMDVVNAINPSGRTDSYNGLRLAYQSASKNIMEDGNNQVILATDGAFELDSKTKKLITGYARKGIKLTVFHFGNTVKSEHTEILLEMTNLGNGSYQRIPTENMAIEALVRASKKRF